jgi:integrase
VAARSPRIPSYRLHRASGQGIATFNGRDVYFGHHRDPASRAAYDRMLAQWLANGREIPTVEPLTIAQLIVRYIHHVDERYQSNEPANIRHALKPLRVLYGMTLVTEFGPMALKTVRQSFVNDKICRNEINKRTRRIVRLFKWGVAEELVPATVHQALKTVEGLKRGSVAVRESKPVKPVPDQFVDAIQPFTSRQVWAMIQLHRLTGARPARSAACELNMSGDIWEYTPERHKTQNHGKARTIYVGARAQEVLRPWLRIELERYLFSPAEAEAERREQQRLVRKSKVQPSQENREKRRPKLQPGDHYTTGTYFQAIGYAIKRLNRDRVKRNEPEIPSWHPHQLRHNFGTEIRRQHGLDVARVLLGHSSPVVTEVYAELDQAKAIDALSRSG